MGRNEFAPQVSGSGECSSVFVHPDAGSGGTLSGDSSPETATAGAAKTSSWTGLLKGGNVLQQPEGTSGSRTHEFRPQPPPLPGEEEVRVLKGRIPGFPQNESAVGFPSVRKKSTPERFPVFLAFRCFPAVAAGKV